MAILSPKLSPLSMVVLAFLAEAPMHAYRMHELIKERGKDGVVNVAQRNSVYQTIDRLLRSELIRVRETSREEGRPERVVYQITDAGSEALHAWLRDNLAVPAREFPSLPAALAFVALLSPKDVLTHLTSRLAVLEQQLVDGRATLEKLLAEGLPRLFLIEEEYRHAMLAAEIAFVQALTRDLRGGKLTWSREWLRKVALQLQERE